MAELTFSHLRKAYAATVASDDVSFEVRSGEVFGLLGPNGAGKSTLIRMLMDIIAPDAGEILLDGHRLGPKDRDRIGYLPEERGLYRKEKVIDVLIYFGMLKGLVRAAARQRALAWLDRVDLAAMAERRVDQMSKGQQQKVQIAGTLLHDPSILVMDEPFSGLDPMNTVLVRDLLQERSRAGCIVVLSTHQMPLVEALCDRVAMIHQGRLVLYGPLEEIRRQDGEASVLVEADGEIPTLDIAARSERQGPRVRIFLKPGAGPRDLMERMLRHGVPLQHFEVVRTPLEEIFVRTVRRLDAAPAERGALAGARS
ncbi:MAG TPA: ATP-binding cassette domain-containing protein [Candidatus Cryosericum sp.]|nr:ATP-binding cassette domain-containing protein [Candidatus Cryosericum sp.]